MSTIQRFSNTESVTVINLLTGKTIMSNKGHPAFDKLKSLSLQEIHAQFEDLTILATAPLRALLTFEYVNDSGEVFAFIEKNNSIFADLNGQGQVAVPRTLGSAMINSIGNNEELKRFAAFFTKVINNPFSDIAEDLFAWLQNAQIAITEEGNFLAFKRIRSDWKDIYTGKMDNSVGATVSMPASMVETNRDHTCAPGLHFASWGYLDSYSNVMNSRTVIVEVDPSSVMRIPSDYNRMKGVAHTYKVIAEVPNPEDGEFSLDSL